MTVMTWAWLAVAALFAWTWLRDLRRDWRMRPDNPLVESLSVLTGVVLALALLQPACPVGVTTVGKGGPARVSYVEASAGLGAIGLGDVVEYRDGARLMVGAVVVALPGEGIASDGVGGRLVEPCGRVAGTDEVLLASWPGPDAVTCEMIRRVKTSDLATHCIFVYSPLASFGPCREHER